MNVQEFRQLISNYDLIVLSETHTDEFDTIDIPGYTYFPKHRTKQSFKKSGGLGLLVYTFLPNTVELQSKSDFDQWFRI